MSAHSLLGIQELLPRLEVRSFLQVSEEVRIQMDEVEEEYQTPVPRIRPLLILGRSQLELPPLRVKLGATPLLRGIVRTSVLEGIVEVGVQ